MRWFNKWGLLLAVWTAWWLIVAIWITVFDCPPGSSYWNWCIDTTGYWHEMALPLMSWLSGVAIIVGLMLTFETTAAMRELKEFLKLWLRDH